MCRLDSRFDRARIAEIKRILETPVSPVKYICISCQEGEQANRKDRLCLGCLEARAQE